MPKVNQLSRIGRKKQKVKAFVKGKMYSVDLKQKDYGRKLGVTQQSAGRKINESSYTLEDLWLLVEMLELTDEEIVQIMRL